MQISGCTRNIVSQVPYSQIPKDLRITVIPKSDSIEFLIAVLLTSAPLRIQDLKV